MKSSWLVLIYARCMPICSNNWSFVLISISRMCIFTIFSTSSWSLGYLDIYKMKYHSYNYFCLLTTVNQLIFIPLLYTYEFHIFLTMHTKNICDNSLWKLTFWEHICTTSVNSCTTISTHFKVGSFNLSNCSFTITSNAMWGVNKPVLKYNK